MSEFYAGMPLRLSNWAGTLENSQGGFQDDTGTLVDPGSITLKVRNPSGVTNTYTTQVVKDAVGRYHYDVDSTGEPGWWTFAWSSQGPQTYQPLSFIVKPSPI